MCALTFAGTVEVPGKVEFVHPLHNLAVVSYDPRLIGDTPVRAATLRRPGTRSPGDHVWVVGPAQRLEDALAAYRRWRASSAVAFPLSRTLRFRDSNLEAVQPGERARRLRRGARRQGRRCVALWSSFAFENGAELEQVNRGIPAELVTEMIDVVARPGGRCYSLEAEFDVQSLARARRAGLAGHLGEAPRGAQSDAPAGAQHRSAGRRHARRSAARAGRSAARDRRQGREPLPRSRARRAEAARSR